MKKDFYESPLIEVQKMQTYDCILQTSDGLQDYNPIDFNWGI